MNERCSKWWREFLINNKQEITFSEVVQYAWEAQDKHYSAKIKELEQQIERLEYEILERGEYE